MISVEQSAVEKVASLLDSEEGTEGMALRVAVRPGGCSGFSYEMFFDDEIGEGDHKEVVAGKSREVTVVVDPASAQLLQGATLSYSDGLNSSGFKINNPNATRSCGCGQSFS